MKTVSKARVFSHPAMRANNRPVFQTLDEASITGKYNIGIVPNIYPSITRLSDVIVSAKIKTTDNGFSITWK